jgi:signal transduction histidine kinase
VAVAAVTEALEESLSGFPADPEADRALTLEADKVLQSGRPIFLPQIPEDLMNRLATNPERAAAVQAMSPGSLIIMPMTVRGHTVGVMSFLRTAESPSFDREDLSLAGQLSRRTALAADNARLYTEARRANDAKDEFLGMMSHELRTPITVIRGGARVLRARVTHLDAETRDSLLNDIERESERLSRMLENLLALARAELDREVILEPVLLQRLLPRLLESQGAGAGRDVEFSSEGVLPAVAAEPGYIEHIVRNLVGNAMKYSPPDAPIQVVVSGCEGGATVRVLDRGFGIGSDEANRIFERFYRSDRTSRLAGGAGLGLAVCKRLVEAMSGEIWAKPRDGGGLEVGLRLPAYQEEVEV